MGQMAECIHSGAGNARARHCTAWYSSSPPRRRRELLPRRPPAQRTPRSQLRKARQQHEKPLAGVTANKASQHVDRGRCRISTGVLHATRVCAVMAVPDTFAVRAQTSFSLAAFSTGMRSPIWFASSASRATWSQSWSESTRMPSDWRSSCGGPDWQGSSVSLRTQPGHSCPWGGNKHTFRFHGSSRQGNHLEGWSGFCLVARVRQRWGRRIPEAVRRHEQDVRRLHFQHAILQVHPAPQPGRLVLVRRHCPNCA